MNFSRIKYRFSQNSRKWENVIRLIDNLGYFFCKTEGNRVILEDIKSVCFVQLAHIGDFALMLPTVNAFKQLSNKKVSVAINPVNKLLASQLSFIDDIFVINHPSFYRTDISKISEFVKDFMKIKTDLVFELRGDIRIIPFVKLLSNVSFIIGYDGGGFGFLLDRVLEYPFWEHITKSYETIFDFFHLKNVDPLNLWDVNLIPVENFRIKFDDYICVNIGVGGSARDWEWDKFVNLINLLSERWHIVVIGKETKEKSEFYKRNLIKNKRVEILINKTSITESNHIIKNACYFIGLESGFTHIASLLGKKTLSIYSDATDAAVWKPVELFKNQIVLIKKHVDCGKCGKLICADNKCMNQISVGEVYDKIMQHIV